MDFKGTHPLPDSFEDICFVHCSFAGCDLSKMTFSNCEFRACDLSMAQCGETGFRNVLFKDCKMLGMHFENCNKLIFFVRFEQCTLHFSCFYKLNMKKQQFISCQLREADFSEADLSGALFSDCDLLDAVFDGTLLEKADFRTARNYRIDPERNRLKEARFSAGGLEGLLHRHRLHIEY